jgi:flavodoxin
MSLSFTACAKDNTEVEGKDAENNNVVVDADSKILVVYFSHTGNTRKVATEIHEQAGGDIFRIELAVPYSDDMEALVKRKNEELASGKMPQLKAKVEKIESYDVIFLGYPIWAMTAPPPVRSFIESHNLEGKIVVPFCTHDGYGQGNSVDVIKQLLSANVKVLESFDVKGSDADSAKQRIKSWLEKIGITPKGFTTKIFGLYNKNFIAAKQ